MIWVTLHKIVILSGSLLLPLSNMYDTSYLLPRVVIGIKENIGKRLEVAGIEVPGDDGSILFIQRLIFDELLISKSEADKKANDKVDLSDMDNMYQ